MTHSIATDYANNYCYRSLVIRVSVEKVVTCFFSETQCSRDKLNITQ